MFDSTISQIFALQVAKNPDNLAVVYDAQAFTYAQIDQLSNQLARFIQDEYHKKYHTALPLETCITVCMDRGWEMIVAILAILKLGAAYVPIDPSYPEERIQFIIEDTSAKLVLTQTHWRALFTANRASVIAMDTLPWNNMSPEYDRPDITAHHLAYIIYTSGTTGKPKGVMIEHKGVVNLAYAQAASFGLRQGVPKACLQFASIGFDAAVSEIFCALLFGHPLYIASDAQRKDLYQLQALLLQAKIAVATLGPSLLSNFEIRSPHLQTLVVAGEAPDKTVLDKYVDQNITVINAYGPTEVTVCASMNVYQKNTSHKDIGKPLANTQIYLLDADLNSVPLGVVGEIYVGGIGLARGYLNQPALTQARFIHHETRLYKTGDLARWLSNGNLEYVGRNDSQVKIRGFRIELEEIANILNQIAGIKKALVQLKEKVTAVGIHKQLVAYYTLDAPVAEATILAQLQRTLPEYMIPAHLMPLKNFPLTLHGKIDFKALPDPELQVRVTYVPPRNTIEHQLCEIWQMVLGVKRVGITDDFFRIGGDSILSLQLHAKMQAVGMYCSIKNIFEHRTIAEMSVMLARAAPCVPVLAEQGILSGNFPLLPIQEWFFEKCASGEFKNAGHYNQSFLIHVPELDIPKLELAMQNLVVLHDVLRIYFLKNENGKFSQTYHKTVRVPPLKILHLNAAIRLEDMASILTNWQSHFDIEKGPLWQMGYIHGYPDKTARIYFACHHLIIDGVSWRILLQDLKYLYDKAQFLRTKTTSYRQWINFVTEYVLHHPDEMEFWHKLQSEQPDYDHHACSETQILHIDIERSITHALIHHANHAYQTEINDLLLTALLYTLHHWNPIQSHYITLEGHGREHMNEELDLSKTMGWFTTLHPITLALKENLHETIQYIKKSLRGIPNKGLGYGAFKYCSAHRNQLKPLPRISFNYLGQYDRIDTDWQIISETSGKSVADENYDGNILGIDGLVMDEKLHFTIKSRLSSFEINTFAREFKRQLERVTQHCLATKKINDTRSDLGEFTPYLILQENNLKPLFVFPPGDGGYESYLSNLVSFSDRKLVLFNNLYLHVVEQFGQASSIVKNYTYEKLALEHIALIKKIQPEGPYQLFGCSFGGLLAFEVARQLNAQGDQVEKLSIVDSYFEQRKILSQLCSQLHITIQEQDINYCYTPSNTLFEPGTQITLFKCMQAAQISGFAQNWEGLRPYLCQYYADHTKDNHISSVVSNTVEIVPIAIEHDAMFTDLKVFQKIVEYL